MELAGLEPATSWVRSKLALAGSSVRTWALAGNSPRLPKPDLPGWQRIIRRLPLIQALAAIRAFKSSDRMSDAQAPNANAHAERRVRTVREECLGRRQPGRSRSAPTSTTLEEVHKVLRETARARLTITEEKLFERVRAKVGNTSAIDFRALLREIADHDEAAERPPLPSVVQGSGSPPDDVRIRLAAVWNYWASGPNGQTAVAEGTESTLPVPPVQPPRPGWLIRIRQCLPLIR